MVLQIVKKRLTDLILKAQKADEAELVLLREKILSMVSKVGAKYFVNSTAEVLKNSFQIEGCNDARIPLKRIFNIPLDELDEKLLRSTDNLPEAHPIRILSVGLLFFFRSFKFNELMYRPLGRAAFVASAPFALAGARAHSTLAWSLA